MQVSRDRDNNTITLSQTNTSRILERFNMTNCHPVSTPQDINVKLNKGMSPTTKEAQESSQHTLQRSSRALMYLGVVQDLTSPCYMHNQVPQHPSKNIGHNKKI